MTSKRSRHHSTDDDEIAIHDDVQTNIRKRGRTGKKKQPTKTEEKKDDVLADLDLEGVPDEEKEQIRLAILASREEVVPQARHDILTTEEDGDISREDDTEIETLQDDDTAREMSDDDILSETTKKCVPTEDHTDAYCLPTQSDNPKDAVETEYAMTTQEDEQNMGTEKDQCDNNTDDEEVLLDFSKSTLNDDDDGGNDLDDDDETQKPDSPVSNDNHNDCDQQDNIQTDMQQDQGHCISSQTCSAKPEEGQGSKEMKERLSQRSQSVESQGSEGFLPTLPDSDSQTSISKDTLERHYRAVKYKLSRGKSYYCPDETDPQKYVIVISQLFDIYNKKLRCAQQQLFRNTGKLKWQESIKTGQHHEKSIDAKRRGHEVCFFDLTELGDKEDFQTETLNKEKPRKVYRMSESDDDLPALVVEESRTGQPYRFKQTRYTAAEAAHIISEDSSAGKPRGPVVEDIGDKGRASSHKRNGRKLGKGNNKVEQKVIVSDTQFYQYDSDDFLVTDRTTKINTGPVIEETQISDDDGNDKWLNVNKNVGRVENKNQKEQLKGYTIPQKNNLNSLKAENKKTEKEKNIKSHGKKRKIETPGKVIVEDTQDFELEEPTSNKKQNKKMKRECYKIESNSDEESIPETQTDISPSKLEEKENASQGYLNTFYSKVKNLVSHATDTKQDPPLVIKRQRKLFTEAVSKFNTTPVCNIKTKNQNEPDCPPVDIMFEAKRNTNPDKKDYLRFSRNASKDSIQSTNSDDVSITSSQVSTTLIDDNGDLYSTQIGEMRNMKKTCRTRKTTKQHIETEDNVNKKEKENDDSDEDVVLIDVESKDANDGGGNIAFKNIKGARNKKIDQCFGWAQEDPIESQKRNIDSDSNELNHHKKTNLIEDADDDAFDENPFPKTYSKKHVREAKPSHGSPDKVSQSGVRSTTNWHSNEEYVDGEAKSIKKNTRVQLENQTRKTNKWDIEYTQPINLQHFSGDKHQQHFSGDKHQPPTVTRNRRQGNKGRPSATKHTPDVFDVDTGEIEIREDVSEEENEVTIKPQVTMVECPICGKQFSAETVEQHAGSCEVPTIQGEAHMMQEDVPANGELESCPICDKQIPKAISERHVEECWNQAAQRETQQPPPEEEPIQTRRGKKRNAVPEPPEVVSPRRPLHRNRENIDRH